MPGFTEVAMPLFICTFITEISLVQLSTVPFQISSLWHLLILCTAHQLFHIDPSAMHICVAEYQVKHTSFLL